MTKTKKDRGGRKKSLVGWTYKDYDWSTDRLRGQLTINCCGVNIVTKEYKNSSDFLKSHYPKKVRITITEL